MKLEDIKHLVERHPERQMWMQVYMWSMCSHVCVYVYTCVCVCVCLGEKWGLTFSKMLNHKHSPATFLFPTLLYSCYIHHTCPGGPFSFFLVDPWHNGDFNTNDVARNVAFAPDGALASPDITLSSKEGLTTTMRGWYTLHPLFWGTLRHPLHLKIFPFHTRQLSWRTKRQKDKGIHLQQETFIKEGNTRRLNSREVEYTSSEVRSYRSKPGVCHYEMNDLRQVT